VSDIPNEDGGVDWNAVIDLLREGKTAVIPCANERDCARLSTRVAKRAERKGIAIEVVKGEGVLRVEPRPAADSPVTPHDGGE
jgi:hypothetical protein